MKVAEARMLAAHLPGRSLAASVQLQQQKLSTAVDLIQLQIKSIGRALPVASRLESFLRLFGSRWELTDLESGELGLRTARALAAVHLLALRNTTGIQTLADSQRWFLGGRISDIPIIDLPALEPDAASMLESLADLDGFDDLFPYILEPFEFAHRIDAKNSDRGSQLRDLKKGSGTFYTPGDVAKLLAREALGDVAPNARVLDPACGSGVLLVSVFREVQARYPSETPASILARFYGVDNSGIAIEAAAFALANEWLAAEPRTDPWTAWHAIRLNLTVGDASKWSAISRGSIESEYAERLTCRSQIVSGGVVPHALTRRGSCARDAFPEAENGFEVIVCNPPYVRLPLDEGGEGRTNLCLAFVELLWKASNPGGSRSAVILPFSIAFARTEGFRRTRRELSARGGELKFAFFDREPHGLFGEEVKTRSAILIREHSAVRTGEAATIHTTPLLRFTSRTRSTLLTDIPFVPLGRRDIEPGIVRIGGDSQFGLLRQIERLMVDFDCRQPWDVSGVPFPSLIEPDKSGETVCVGPVAYNFMNVMRNPHEFARLSSTRSTKSSFHVWRLPDRETADVLFAVLSSRLVFWLWTVFGDGFHVSRSFLAELPIPNRRLDTTSRQSLAELGSKLWMSIAPAPIVSHNSGAWSVAFSPVRESELLDAIDGILFSAFGLPLRMCAEIRQFIKQRAIVDAHEECRQNVFAAVGGV